MAREAYRKSRLAMPRAQANARGLCHVAFWPGDPIDDRHIVRKHEGGSNDLVNRVLAHFERSWGSDVMSLAHVEQTGVGYFTQGSKP